jgi:thiosulfate/3-mercaptopyruvate sulfurtransferase
MLDTERLMDTPIVVETQWLADRLEATDVAVIDVRPPQFYTQGQIPGAVNLPFFLVTGQGAEPLSAGVLSARLSALGLTRQHHVIAYDDGGSPAAASLFRLLRYYRHPLVSVLNGGITKWMHEGRPTANGLSRRSPAKYEPGEPDRSQLAHAEDVLQAIGASGTVILDVRSPAEYLGIERTAARDGHIPGAINIDWSNNLTQTEDAIYLLRPEGELRSLYEQAGLTPDKKAIVYCASGNRASETYMVLKELGYPEVSVYQSGWQEWGNRPELPVEEQ